MSKIITAVEVLTALHRGVSKEAPIVVCSVKTLSNGWPAYGVTDPTSPTTEEFLSVGKNNYFSASTIKWHAKPAKGPLAFTRRWAANATEMLTITLDDIGTGPGSKVHPDKLSSAPVPTLIVETSDHNYQWSYFLTRPDKDIDRAMALLNGLAMRGLTDPCVVDRVRLLRLPNSSNTKHHPPFRTVAELWQRDTTYTVPQLAKLFGIDLTIPAPLSSTEDDDDPTTKALVKDPTRDGWLMLMHTLHIDAQPHPRAHLRRIPCPWEHTHTGGAENTVYRLGGGFICPHSHCKDKRFNDYRDYLITLAGTKGIVVDKTLLNSTADWADEGATRDPLAEPRDEEMEMEMEMETETEAHHVTLSSHRRGVPRINMDPLEDPMFEDEAVLGLYNDDPLLGPTTEQVLSLERNSGCPLYGMETPPELLNPITGLHALLAEYLDTRAHRECKPFAVAGSLSTLSALTANTYYIRAAGDGPPIGLNLYAMLSGPTSLGKSAPRKVTGDILTAMGLDDVMFEDMASGAAMLSHLEQSAKQGVGLLLADDEFGRKGSGANDSNRQTLSTALLTLYDAARTTYKGKGYADVKRGDMRMTRPYLNILSTTTPGTLRTGIDVGDIHGGLLNRYIITETRQVHPKRTVYPSLTKEKTHAMSQALSRLSVVTMTVRLVHQDADEGTNPAAMSKRAAREALALYDRGEMDWEDAAQTVAMDEMTETEEAKPLEDAARSSAMTALFRVTNPKIHAGIGVAISDEAVPVFSAILKREDAYYVPEEGEAAMGPDEDDAVFGRLLEKSYRVAALCAISRAAAGEGIGDLMCPVVSRRDALWAGYWVLQHDSLVRWALVPEIVVDPTVGLAYRIAALLDQVHAHGMASVRKEFRKRAQVVAAVTLQKALPDWYIRRVFRRTPAVLVDLAMDHLIAQREIVRLKGRQVAATTGGRKTKSCVVLRSNRMAVRVSSEEDDDEGEKDTDYPAAVSGVGGL